MTRCLWVLVVLAGAGAAQEHASDWTQRRRPGGERSVRAVGGSGATEGAVELGLAWLVRHQDEDGRWNADGFAAHDPADDKCDGAGAQGHDVGVSALALLGFLGAGYDDRVDARYAGTVRRGLAFLMRMRGEDGLVRDGEDERFVYGHALATAALCEAWALTRDERYRAPAVAALDWLARAQNPDGGWRYAPRRPPSDASVTAWCALALHAGRLSGLAESAEALERARGFMRARTDPETGVAGYLERGGPVFRPPGSAVRFPPEKSCATTAAAILVRALAGDDPRRKPDLKAGARHCRERAPRWNPDDGSIDLASWCFGSYALFQVGGEPWRVWNDALAEAAPRHQHPEGSGARTGSWDPIGVWGREGGRVYATATMVLCLEVYYRYPRLYLWPH